MITVAIVLILTVAGILAATIVELGRDGYRRTPERRLGHTAFNRQS